MTPVLARGTAAPLLSISSPAWAIIAPLSMQKRASVAYSFPPRSPTFNAPNDEPSFHSLQEDQQYSSLHYAHVRAKH